MVIFQNDQIFVEQKQTHVNFSSSEPSIRVNWCECWWNFQKLIELAPTRSPENGFSAAIHFPPTPRSPSSIVAALGALLSSLTGVKNSAFLKFWPAIETTATWATFGGKNTLPEGLAPISDADLSSFLTSPSPLSFSLGEAYQLTSSLSLTRAFLRISSFFQKKRKFLRCL